MRRRSPSAISLLAISRTQAEALCVKGDACAISAGLQRQRLSYRAGSEMEPERASVWRLCLEKYMSKLGGS